MPSLLQLVSSRDFRLNFRLQSACMQDVNRLCAGGRCRRCCRRAWVLWFPMGMQHTWMHACQPTTATQPAYPPVSRIHYSPTPKPTQHPSPSPSPLPAPRPPWPPTPAAGVVSQCSGGLCGGKVLSCLRDRMGEVRGEECRNEVFHFVKAEVSD